MEGMACYWIALILLRCSGNQATILLEALVLMANLVDHGEQKRRRSIQFRSHLLDLTNLLKRSVKPEASAVSSLLLDYQAYYNQHYSLQSVLKPITVNALIYSTYSCIQAHI